MRRGIVAVTGFALLMSVPIVAYAAGVFGGKSGLDPSFCKAHNIRQTVVYVDDMLLVTDKTGWAHDLYDKLKATLVPGERVSVVELSPSDGQSSEVWSGCWPDYSEAKREELKKGFYFFSRNPLATLKDQQNYFARDFGVALGRVQERGQRSVDAVVIDPSHPPQKSILRALTSDGARYSHSDTTIRAIVYSDLAENSDLGSVFQPSPDPPVDFGQKLGTYLRRSVFYVFGVGIDVRGGGSTQDRIRSFWKDALLSMAANIGGMGTDLNVPNMVPVTAEAYTVSVTDLGETLSGRLSLLADNDGTLVDSWIGISRLRNALVNGIYRCTGAAPKPSCTLQATTVGGVVTTMPSETIHMIPQSDGVMAGRIGVPGSNVDLAISATPATD